MPSPGSTRSAAADTSEGACVFSTRRREPPIPSRHRRSSAQGAFLLRLPSHSDGVGLQDDQPVDVHIVSPRAPRSQRSEDVNRVGGVGVRATFAERGLREGLAGFSRRDAVNYGLARESKRGLPPLSTPRIVSAL